ncbi:MAG: response regulator, partial [Hydrococcus sp. Prado102]|nr:response regulator [Hydrococcus sp. Prado102]
MLFNLSLLKKTITLLPIFTGALLIADIGHAGSPSPSQQEPSAKQEVPHKKDNTQIEQSIASAKKAFLGKHHKELEFIGVASLVGLGILSPELFRKKKAHNTKENESIQQSTPIEEKKPTSLATQLKTEKELDVTPPVKALPANNDIISNVIKIDTELQHRISTNPPQESELKSTVARSIVLIVDDSLMIREMLSETFTRAGYQIEQACDGLDAWEKLNAGLFCDLILCDIEMPRMNGLELLSHLQQDKKLSAIPFAVLTSHSDQKLRDQAIEQGAKGYFLKPHA